MKKISIYNECFTDIYTYSLCIYEYILILSTLVYVRYAKKKKVIKKIIKRRGLVDHLATCIFFLIEVGFVGYLIIMLKFLSFCIPQF